MTKDSLIPWTDAEERLPEDEFQWLKLRCSDGRDRYGYGTRWPDGSFAGWMIDGLRDFVEQVEFSSYKVTGWMPADIPEPVMEMPV
jgi:hypothetical protein